MALLVVATFAGCGSKQAGLTNGQAQALVAQLEAARATAAARDANGIQAALVRFRRSVARLERDGALSPETARALRIGAQRVARRVVSDSAPPARPAPAVTRTTPAAAPPGEKRKDKHGRGHGKHGEDDD